jgi:hypothetical protein
MVSDDNRDILSLPVPPSVRLTMLFCDALMVAGCLAAIIVYSPYMSEAAAGMEDPPTLSLLHPVAVSFSAILLMVVCKWVLVCNETYRSFVSATLAISLAVIEIAAFLIFFLFAMMSIGRCWECVCYAGILVDIHSSTHTCHSNKQACLCFSKLLHPDTCTSCSWASPGAPSRSGGSSHSHNACHSHR